MARSNGLSAPQTLRQIPPPEPAFPQAGDDIEIEFAQSPDTAHTDEAGNIVSIEHGDGSITVSVTDEPLERVLGDEPDGDTWFANLVDKIGDSELSRIADDLLRGIDDDLTSRRDWIQTRAEGVKMLGLKYEAPNSGALDGAPVEGMSNVRHPLLLEAVLRFQANARSEMLPTDGPVKIRNDDNDASFEDDQQANALERDLNHYLTSTATEYYPDTDRMFLMLGFGGTAFKKVYYCPLRNRPVSETVDADDLIVNNDATDLANAKRVTHRLMMRPSTVRRMQILGVYRDIALSTPQPRKLDAYQQEEKSQQGEAQDSSNPLDRDREIYECYCELDIAGMEHRHKGRASGLEIPYRVTIDVSSREILSIVRNYDQETEDLPVARRTFVKFTFVPGFGFYDIGLLNILGNTTRAITAAWREMLDNGMFANFPGFLVAKHGTRQNTNIFRVPPGGGVQVDTGGQPISQAISQLPYNTGHMAPLMQLTDKMAETGMRIGGTSEQQVGEGRADAPVGTTLALIDQATKMLNAVHKRMHAAQAEEFRLLCECFEAHPESFWKRNFKPTLPWDEQTFLSALRNYDLVPQADPNTASHGQRVMKIVALKQLQVASPQLYDPVAVDTAALQTMGWSNPNQFFKPEAERNQPTPDMMKGMAEAVNDGKTADAAMITAQARQTEVQTKVQTGAFAPKPAAQGLSGAQPDPSVGQAAIMKAQASLIDAQTKREDLDMRQQREDQDDQSRDADRESKEGIELLKLAQATITHPEGNTAGAKKLAKLAEEQFDRSDENEE